MAWGPGPSGRGRSGSPGPTDTSELDNESPADYLRRYGWVLLPVTMVFCVPALLVVGGLALASGPEASSVETAKFATTWVQVTIVFVIPMIAVYFWSKWSEYKPRLREELFDDGTDTPWLFSLELLSYLGVLVGLLLLVVFLFAGSPPDEFVYVPPWRGSIAAQYGIYSRWGWFLGALALYGSPLVLGFARFAEAFEFTGDRGEDDDQHVTDRFR